MGGMSTCCALTSRTPLTLFATSSASSMAAVPSSVTTPALASTVIRYLRVSGFVASATVFFLADLGRLLAALGNRGYRAANLEAGLIGGRLYLAAYAQRFGATGLTFYDDEVVEFFSPHAAGKAALFVTALGRSQAAGKGPSASLAPSSGRST